MQKLKNRGSFIGLQTKTKDSKDPPLSIIKTAQKSLNKSLKIKRSSTTHLNQYSKLLLLQKSQDPKHLGLLKRDGNIKNAIESIGVTLRQTSIKKGEEIKKVDNLLQIFKKRVSQSNPIFNTNNFIQRIETNQTTRTIKTSQASSRKSLHKKGSSMGKLCLGKNIVPEYIPKKQQRLNPFYEQPKIITENMINSKGVYNLINAGVLPSEYDFLEILNNKYEPVLETMITVLEKKQEQIMKIEEEAETFMTNPALMNQYEEHKKTSEAELIEMGKSKNPSEEIDKKKQNKIRKTKLKKVKKVKNDPVEKLVELLVFDLPVMTISDGQIEKNENYKMHLKQCLKQGTELDFFELVQRMQKFVLKYKIKKINFKPHLMFIKNLTESYLLHLIQNYKTYGLDRRVRSKQNNFELLILRAFDMQRMKKMKFYLRKIENLKKYYMMRKLYHECIDKRYNFYKYRLGSFAQQQRKYMQMFLENRMTIADYHPKIQIHVLTKQTTFSEENTYYKLRQRLRAHLMRLANSRVNEVVLLVDPIMIGNIKEEMNIFFSMLEKLSEKVEKVTNHRQKIHVFCSNFKEDKVSCTGRIYFGINEDIIKDIRRICKNQKPVIIPYESCKLLPFICETLNSNLFGGTYTKESIEMVFDEDRHDNKQENQMKNIVKDHVEDVKFKKIEVKHTFQKAISKLKMFELANFVYEDKSKIYELFSIRLGKQMPYRIETKNKNENEFYEELVAKIISHKESTKWVFKQGKGKFSRGMAIFETNDLKIFQQNRKKSELLKQEVTEISKIMSVILKDKIVLSHGNLMQRKQFLTEFFTSENSYVEQYIQHSHKICAFGKILPNGNFVFMGSYKKHYTNGIGFGASYPAEEVNYEIYEELRQLSMKLFEQNVFGYVTFEFLYQEKSKRLLYLDFTPNLDEYSSLYFLYDSLFKAENMYPEDLELNKLPKNIFYCPFLDNNGNNFDEIEEFLDECRMKKIWYNPTTQEGQRFMFYQNDPSVLSLLIFSSSEFHSIKMCIDAISFLVETGGKFYQFDKKYMGAKDLKTDGLYIMDILWKLREVRKKMEGTSAQQQKSFYNG